MPRMYQGSNLQGFCPLCTATLAGAGLGANQSPRVRDLSRRLALRSAYALLVALSDTA